MNDFDLVIRSRARIACREAHIRHESLVNPYPPGCVQHIGWEEERTQIQHDIENDQIKGRDLALEVWERSKDTRALRVVPESLNESEASGWHGAAWRIIREKLGTEVQKQEAMAS